MPLLDQHCFIKSPHDTVCHDARGQKDGGSGERKTEQRRTGGTKAARENYVVAEMKGKRLGKGSREQSEERQKKKSSKN